MTELKLNFEKDEGDWSQYDGNVECFDEFHFYYEKYPKDVDCESMSPVSTCPSQSEARLCFFDLCSEETAQESNRLMKRKHYCSEQFETLKMAIEQYENAVNKYLQNSFHSENNETMDFLSIEQFSELTLIKQQYSTVISKFQSTKNQQYKIPLFLYDDQNIVVKFLSEILYLNYYQINMEILEIIFKSYQHISNPKQSNHNEDVLNFCREIASCQSIQFINFKFINHNGNNQELVCLIHKIYEIMNVLLQSSNQHQTEFKRQSICQNQQKISQKMLQGLILFTSSNDLWGEQDEQSEEYFISQTSKKIKI